MQTFTVDKLTVRRFPTREEMGASAAADIKRRVSALLREKEMINIIFAAAPSQNEVLAALAADTDIPWDRVRAFHMDEYIGLPADAPQGFGNFLKERLFGPAGLKNVFYIDGTAADAAGECRRYAALLEEYPPDIVVLGIGENGHIAFNDPPVADLHDPEAVKTVRLDDVCRRQQVNDGCFADLSGVPETAVTLTIPALLAGQYLFCVVPAASKAKAVRDTLRGEIGEHCPATALRRHPNAVLYLDGDSASLLDL